ncbi:glycerophosphoryl diester phosphodiesterase membrane domain-containing protein [Aurantiacibacter marinus]|uniref:glycerophosphoryl diester phosphodiesterase membrane domain-containing protein n=1 Tax=Aurantiacibacter marinus TaxID=874156 RepID=UPI000699E3B5|nr:glycerophosphoryl diester phosphodiesterase membrane domain-containing protein [Aurantiacibacter marinus]
MAIKLDMGKAWNDAVAMLVANKDVVLIIAGVFFFLPNAIASLAMPQATAELEAMTASGAEPDPEAMLEMFTAMYAEIWWVIVLLALFQAAGVLSLLALLTDSARPTVGEALKLGAKALIPYIGVQLLGGLLLVVAIALPAGLGALIAPGIGALLALIGMVFAVYMYVKISLTSPVIAIEKVMNPFTALRRSWQLTKGNSFRLFAFYLLLILVLIVISAITGMVWAIFSIMGEQVGLFASAIGGAIVSMVTVSIFMAVLAAVHRQLSGGTAETTKETFA